MNNSSTPYSCDAEQAVLGRLMLDNDRWDDSESELRDMANGPSIPQGLPLFESGAMFKGESVEIYYDREALILVASPKLREVLECALREVQ